LLLLLQATIEEKQKQYRTAEGSVKFYLHYGNSLVSLLHYLTREIKEPFMNAALVDRIASMLNSYLAALATKRAESLQVRKSREYNWHPQV
jgi:hypothetical protein